MNCQYTYRWRRSFQWAPNDMDDSVCRWDIPIYNELLVYQLIKLRTLHKGELPQVTQTTTSFNLTKVSFHRGQQMNGLFSAMVPRLYQPTTHLMNEFIFCDIFKYGNKMCMFNTHVKTAACIL